LKPQLKKVLLNGGSGALILSGSPFIFQLVQSQIDQHEISKSLIRNLVPANVSLSFVLFIISAVFLANAISLNKSLIEVRTENKALKKEYYERSPEERVAQSLLSYANKLSVQNKNEAVIRIRNNFSRSLHILGFKEVRIALGEIALPSAVINNDDFTKVQILIDDLGWTNYILGNIQIAIQNINRGIEIASNTKNTLNNKENLELKLFQAKGFRHLALIKNQQSHPEALTLLQKSIHILEALDLSEAKVKRDFGQIYHAHALLIAEELGIKEKGAIRRGDNEAVSQLQEALNETRKSAEIMKELKDQERYCKALALEVRLLEASGAETETKEVSALLNHMLTISERKEL